LIVNAIEIKDEILSKITESFSLTATNDYEIQKFREGRETSNGIAFTYDFRDEPKDVSKYDYHVFLLCGKYSSDNRTVTLDSFSTNENLKTIPDNAFMKGGQVDTKICLTIGLKVQLVSSYPKESTQPPVSSYPKESSNPKETMTQPQVSSQPPVSTQPLPKSNDKTVEESIEYYKRLLVKLGLGTKSITVSGNKANVLMFMMMLKTKIESERRNAKIPANGVNSTCMDLFKDGVFRTARRLYTYVKYYETVVANKTDNYSVMLQLILHDLKKLCLYGNETPLKENVEYYQIRKIEEKYLADLKLNRDDFLNQLAQYTSENMNIDQTLQDEVNSGFVKEVRDEVGDYDENLLDQVIEKFEENHRRGITGKNAWLMPIDSYVELLKDPDVENGLTLAEKEIMYNTKCKPFLKGYIDLLLEDDSTLKEKGTTNMFERLQQLNKLHDEHVANLKEKHGLKGDTTVQSIKKLNSKVGVIKLLEELTVILRDPDKDVFKDLSTESISWGTKLGYFTVAPGVALSVGYEKLKETAGNKLTIAGKNLLNYVKSRVTPAITSGTPIDVQQNPLLAQSQSPVTNNANNNNNNTVSASSNDAPLSSNDINLEINNLSNPNPSNLPTQPASAADDTERNAAASAAEEKRKQDNADAAKAEQEKAEAEAKAEQEKAEAEAKAEQEKAEAEAKAEQEKAEAEAKAEADRLEKERDAAEEKRIADAAEEKRIADAAEEKRNADAAVAKAEADKLEKERVAAEEKRKQEDAAAAAAAAEADKLEKERVAAEEKRKQEDAAAAAAAAEADKLEKEKAAVKIQAQIRKTNELKRLNEKKKERKQKQEIEKHKVEELGINWRKKMREAIKKGFLTDTSKTAGEKLLGDGVFSKALKTVTAAVVAELKTFWSKIPLDTSSPLQSKKFDGIVDEVAAKLDEFMKTNDADRDAFISKIRAEFKIDKLTDGGRLLQFQQKDNDGLNYWLEISKDNPDKETIFAMFKPEYYADFKKYVLKNVYGFEDSQAKKLLQIFSNFGVLCHMLEYMSANPEDVDKKYINMFQKMDLSEGKVTIAETDTTKSEVTMFRLFKELLARGIAKDDMQIIDGTNHAGSQDFVEIVLISFMYLVFSKPVFTEYTGWLGSSYKAYSYTDFLNNVLKEVVKYGSYIKAAINLISKCYYEEKNRKGYYTLVSKTNKTIKSIITLTEDINVVDTVLLELASLEHLRKTVDGEANAIIIANRIDGKRIGGKRIGGKRIGGKRIGGKRIGGKKFTHKFIKKSPLNKRNAKTTKKNKHFSASASDRTSASDRASTR
jgi:hypothetical protein